MITVAAIKHFFRFTIRNYQFHPHTYYPDAGPKSWKAYCRFGVEIELDPEWDALELNRIEYRQYIAGGIWTARGSTPEWTDDDKPDGNAAVPIPAYIDPPEVEGIPREAVPGIGLRLDRWKEDGEQTGDLIECYGYRDTANLIGEAEADKWEPTQLTGHKYTLRDTPSISGPWGSGDDVWVWVDLWFKGFIVEVHQEKRDSRGRTVPIRKLWEKNWEYHFHNQRFSGMAGPAPD